MDSNDDVVAKTARDLWRAIKASLGHTSNIEQPNAGDLKHEVNDYNSRV
jgi:hypothetical protein